MQALIWKRATLSLFLVLTLAAGSTAHADSDVVSSQHAHAKRLEHVGEWLTGVGAAHFIAGVPTLGVGIYRDSLQEGDNGDAFSFMDEVAGGTCIGIGGALLAVGIPLWIVGRARSRAVERVSTSATPGLTLRF
jgi:hypothetical protein